MRPPRLPRPRHLVFGEDLLEVGNCPVYHRSFCRKLKPDAPAWSWHPPEAETSSAVPAKVSGS